MNKIFASFLFLMLCFSGGRDAEAAVIINEFLADPPSGILGDVNQDGVRSSSQDEFVELLNSGTESQDISFWSLWDSAALRHQFPAFAILAPWESVVIFGGSSHLFDYASAASTGTLSLNNSGDWIVLKDFDGDIVDQIIYGGEANRDQSLTRFPFEPDIFRLHSEVSENFLPFSPGKDFNGQPFKKPFVTPEPASGLLFGLGLLLHGLRMGRMNKTDE
jgi:Lamin Tail Domain